MTYNDHRMEHLEIYDKYTSSLAHEEDVGGAFFGLAPVKPEGDGITYEDAMQSFVDYYEHITYALGYKISREMYEDGIAVPVAMRRAQALARSIIQTMETVAANVLNRAFNSDYTFGDGKELCATDHPNQKGGTYQNKLTTDADFSETALEQALIDIGKMTDDGGLKVAIMAQKLIGPVDLEFDFSRVVDNPNRPNTANRDINATYARGSLPQGYTINHYLTDTDAWFIKTDCPHGMKHFERRGVEFDEDNSFDTETAKFKATFRGSWGCTDKRGIYGSAGAS